MLCICVHGSGFKLYFGVYFRLCIRVHDSGFQLYFGVYFRLCICAGLTGLWFIVQEIGFNPQGSED